MTATTASVPPASSSSPPPIHRPVRGRAVEAGVGRLPAFATVTFAPAEVDETAAMLKMPLAFEGEGHRDTIESSAVDVTCRLAVEIAWSHRRSRGRGDGRGRRLPRLQVDAEAQHAPTLVGPAPEAEIAGELCVGEFETLGQVYATPDGNRRADPARRPTRSRRPWPPRSLDGFVKSHVQGLGSLARDIYGGSRRRLRLMGGRVAAP